MMFRLLVTNTTRGLHVSIELKVILVRVYYPRLSVVLVFTLPILSDSRRSGSFLVVSNRIIVNRTSGQTFGSI